jgi:hypothetical protein
MLVCYALEPRGAWAVLGFALACALAAIYGFLAGTWPFGLVEGVWAIIALARWRRVRRENAVETGSGRHQK